MEDKHDTAFEIGGWAIKETKEVHLALDSHSSSYNQRGIMLNIQNITRSRTELRLCWGLCFHADSWTLLRVGARKAGY